MQDSIKSRAYLGSFDSSEGFHRGRIKLVEMLRYIVKIIFFLSPFPVASNFKVNVLKLFGAEIGEGVVIKPRVNIHFPWKLVIGNNVWIGEEVFLLNFEMLSIGNNVCISQRAFLCGGNHDFRDGAMKYRNGTIILRDGCWVGANVFVGPNVDIGVDSIVSAGTVITKSIASNGIYKSDELRRIGDRWKT